MKILNRKVSKNSKKNFLTFFSKEKKASANMWWIIIGAVIALVVMIILMVMFTDKSNVLEGGLLSCSNKGGECVLESGSCPENSIESFAFDCPDNNGQARKCCLSSLKKVGRSCKLDSECITDNCVSGKCAEAGQTSPPTS